jgi:preprotein translocase subunit SecD
MLATQIGFTLSLAGIAGFIVSVGITADSFVVFFERIKDEVHEGRSARVAIPRAWVRARRTILSADTVSFLAAAVLYYFTTDEVRGFAFTLGLSTLLDLIVVFLFTHPLVSWLSRFRTFGSARFTGLDAVRNGPPIDDRPVSAASETEDERPDVGTARVRRTRPAPQPGPVATLDADAEAELDTGPSTGATALGADRLRKRAKRPAVDTTSNEPDTGATDPVSPAAGDDDLGSIAATDPDEPPTPRRRTAPEPGSAAERAAARRARMRGTKPDTEDQG